MNYTGDIMIVEDEGGDFDLSFENGQPAMTDGLETYVILAVFGEDYFGNDLVKSESDKMNSEFPEIIRRNVVSDKTKNDGTKAIEKALAPMLKEKIAIKITVTGTIQTSYRIGWIIDIEGIDNKSYKYYINWEKGSVTAQIVRK